MSQTPGTSREDRPSFEPPLPAAGSPFGTIVQETVLNPEGRRFLRDSAGAETGSEESSSIPDPEVSRRLFPTEPSAVTVDFEAPAGCELGHFSIEERIGSGGMGAVFRALDTRLQRVVALKVLSPAQSRDRASVLRFENEARAAARLDHENIARVHYFGEDRGLYFIAFEYVTGQNVRDLIARTGRLPVADAVNYALQIAIALRHTAAAGVVHRDIKPSNIIITPSGRAKLVDLGLARKLAADSVGDLTVAGTTLGTFDYISPEQARDPRAVDIRSDIYSLGCTLYHMLTGGPPYSSGTVLQKLLDHQSGQPPDPRAVNPGVPATLSAICRKMMAGEPRERYATPDDLIRELARLAAAMGLRPAPAEGHVWSRPAASQAPRVASGLVWAGSFAVVVLLAVLLDWPRSGEPTALRQGSATSSDAAGERPAAPGEGLPKIAADDGPPPEQFEPDAASPTASERRLEAAASGTASRPDAVGVSSRSTAAARRTETPPATDSQPTPADARTAEAMSFADLAEQVQTIGELFRPVVEPLLAESGEREGVGETGESSPEASRYELTTPFVLWSEGAETQGYDSLAEAVKNAYSGDRIELHFDGLPPDDGLRPEGSPVEPIVIEEKSISIVAADMSPAGRPYRPILEFVGRPGLTGRSHMITVRGDEAGLSLEGIELRMRVSGEARSASRQWGLFTLPGAEHVRLRNVGITLVNPEAWPLTVFDLRPPEDVSREAYEIMGMKDESREEGFRVEFDACFVRGGGELVTIAHTLPGLIAATDSAFAMEMDLLNVTGGPEKPPAGDRVDVRFEHVTAMIGGALLRLDVDQLPRHAAEIRMNARSSLFATSTAGPLVLMTGNASLSTFEQALIWDGWNNLFDGFSQYWAIITEEGAADGAPTTFDLWKSRWARTGTRDARAAERTTPDEAFSDVWLDPEAAKGKSRSLITAEDLALDAEGAWDILSGSDGDLIGASSDRLPPMSDPPDDLSASRRSAPPR